MKKSHFLIWMVTGVLAVHAATLTPDERAAITEAGQNGAKAKVVFHVVDDTGAPVQDARGFFGFFCGREGQVRMTDKDGIAVAEHKCRDEVVWRFTKDGYYKSEGSVKTWRYEKGALQDGKWQPYGATNTVVLKRIRNPIAMFVVPTSRDIVIPVCNVRLPFDLEKGDWLPPYGKGSRPDFDVIFRWNGKKMNEYVGSSLEFAFNKPQSGYYICPQDEYNEFKGPYHAEFGHMLNTNLVLTIKINHENRKVDVLEQGAKQCFILRLRPQVANDGRVVSVRYGKIYGPINFGYLSDGTGAFSCHMYLNPTPNDTNLEFDPDKNLSDDDDWRHKTHFAP